MSDCLQKNQDYHSKIESDQIKTSTLSMSSYVWQHSIKMTWSILNFNECLTACKKSTQSINAWMIDSMRTFWARSEEKNITRYGVCTRIPITIWAFTLDHFQGKMTNVCKKQKMTPFLDHFGHYLPNHGQMEFFQKIGLVNF